MLTPRFSLSQDKDFVTVLIDAPYVKYADGEICITGNEFSFYCKPYHLKLYFSGELVENDTESAEYSVEKGQFTIRLPKSIRGEEFTNLDMLTKLMTPLQPSKTVKASALIEVMDGGTQDDIDVYDDIDWSIEQAFPEEICISLESPRYGLGRKASGVFTKRVEEQHDILDIENPDSTLESDRIHLQKQHERQHFNLDHYLADLVDDDSIQEIISYASTIEQTYRKTLKGDKSVDEVVEYSKEEVESLVRLPKKEYLLDEKQQKASLLGLVDILYACLYDIRTTMEECSVESAWTIRKLSCTLSWLVSSGDAKAIVTSCMRRSLCFPLYRHWGLAKKVLSDVYLTLALGKKQIVKCLLYVRSQFCNTESYHILNDLYITDYCVWVQTVSEKNISSLAQLINQVEVSKEDLDMGIPTLESKYFSGVDNCLSELSDSDVDSEDSESDESESVDGESDRDSDDSESDKSDSDDGESDDCKSVAASQCIASIDVEEQLAKLSVEDGAKPSEITPLIEVISSRSLDGKD